MFWADASENCDPWSQKEIWSNASLCIKIRFFITILKILHSWEKLHICFNFKCVKKELSYEIRFEGNLHRKQKNWSKSEFVHIRIWRYVNFKKVLVCCQLCWTLFDTCCQRNIRNTYQPETRETVTEEYHSFLLLLFWVLHLHLFCICHKESRVLALL